ncbi:MAG: hypothetical protein LUG60_06710 [Erysipelotrichaceae bacterium]|nr:hypothetical protein [Erysipelotrichaceae bacterium]
MSRININNLDGIRRPTLDEINKITRYYEHLYQTNDRTHKTLIVVFSVLGIVSMFAYTTSGLGAIVVGIIFLTIAFQLIRGVFEAEAHLNVFRSGDFIVIPGSVYKIMTDTTDLPGVSDVWFMSLGGKKLNLEFQVRRTDLQIGTPLLLIHVDEDKIKHGLTRVFTPFMLSEEGLKGTLF